MNMDQKRTYIRTSLDNHRIDPRVLNNLAELSYTAEQTGVLSFSVSGEELARIYQLVKLAESLKAQRVPDELRM